MNLLAAEFSGRRSAVSFSPPHCAPAALISQPSHAQKRSGRVPNKPGAPARPASGSTQQIAIISGISTTL